MFKVKVFGKVSDNAKEELKDNYTLGENIDDYDAILVHSTSLHDMDFPKSLKAIVRVGAGTNNIPIDKCTNQGIAVFNTPGGNSNAVKELVVAAMINVTRHIQTTKDWMIEQSSTLEDFSKTIEKAKDLYRGTELMGKTVGIIGVGAIGAKLATVLFEMGMKVIGYDPWLNEHRKEELKQYVEFTNDLDNLYKNSDYITIHLPATKDTEKFINADAIKKMKPTAFVINYARGQLVDHDAILSALDNEKLRGYATDFPTKEELNNPKVFATPHLGADTVEASENCSRMAISQMKAFLENGDIINSVNMPNISSDRANGSRIVLLHKNVVGMLGQITDILSQSGLNIEKLSNKGRGDVAYTIVDFNVKIDDSILKTLEKIGNVISIRIIK